MKRLLSGVGALAVLSALNPAVGQDLTSSAPADQWAGFYAGVHGGYANANRNGCGDIGIDLFDTWSLFEVFPIDSCDGAPVIMAYDYDQSGGLAGIQAGYNWTASENFLVGVELSASASELTGEIDGVFGGIVSWNNLITATAKAGFTHDRFLVYGEAGLGIGNASFVGDLGCEFDASHTAPVAGAGVSFKITDTASIDLKYQRMWMNATQSSCNSTDTVLDPAFLAVPTELRAQGSADIIKIGLNFQIGD